MPKSMVDLPMCGSRSALESSMPSRALPVESVDSKLPPTSSTSPRARFLRLFLVLMALITSGSPSLAFGPSCFSSAYQNLARFSATRYHSLMAHERTLTFRVSALCAGPWLLVILSMKGWSSLTAAGSSLGTARDDTARVRVLTVISMLATKSPGGVAEPMRIVTFFNMGSP